MEQLEANLSRVAAETTLAARPESESGETQCVLIDTFLPKRNLMCPLPGGLLRQTSKHRAEQVSGLNPEGISPRLRARMLAFTCKMYLLVSVI